MNISRGFTFRDLELRFRGQKGSLYKSGKLIFVGSSYIAINWFINYSNNDPNVKAKFENILNIREKAKFKNEKQKDEIQ